jgi:hypothetical protein
VMRLEEIRIVLLAKYYLGDKIKKNEMGQACIMYGGKGNCIFHGKK